MPPGVPALAVLLEAVQVCLCRSCCTEATCLPARHDPECAHGAHAGIDFEPILDQMKEDIVRLLLHFEPQLRAAAAAYPHGARSFFGMYRFDFMLDRSLTPWLIEVNQSPNLSSASTVDLRNMFQRISFSLLSLMGFGHGQLRHPSNAEDHMDIIAHHNDVDIGWRICSACVDSCDGDCAMCRRCRTPVQTRIIRVR
jgi:Tubulin-tyrosine ligase family